MDKQGVPEAQDEMQKLMKEAVVMVRGQADRMETDVITPMYDSYQQLAKDHPALAVFALVFTLLSIVPVTCFLLFSAVVFGTFVVGAICAAVAAALGVCAIAGGFLLFTLSLIFGFAIFVTSTYILVRLGLRLVFHMHSEEGQGLGVWTQESLAFFNLTSPPQYQSSLGDRRGLLAEVDHEEADDIKVEDQRVAGDGSSDEWAAVDHHPAEPRIKLEDAPTTSNAPEPPNFEAPALT
ncbi:hypothetical protein FRC04_007943 [Tulasnella sp. 424]|nr:hypothetical protein FRC04_007943 [Tulasnella sp. 424]KAG8974805.1 hypothetical protein FRC05_006737 [Tulasnella sp. 425]